MKTGELENQELESREVSGVETIIGKKSLKDYASGENKEVIRLLDTKGIEEVLKGLVDKYDGLKANRDNYKKEIKEAEQSLRQIRYKLQKVNESNMALIKFAKEEASGSIERLINIIQPLEKRLHTEMKAMEKVIKDEKEQKEAAEKERKEKIDKALIEWELKLEKMISSASKQEELDKFDEELVTLEETFEEFAEKQFEAERLHAVFTARRTEIVTKIQKIKEEEDKKIAEEERAVKLFNYRENKVVGLGFVLMMETNTYCLEAGNGKIEISSKNLVGMDEIEWMEFYEGIEARKKKLIDTKDEEDRKSIESMKETWDELLKTFVKLGGKTAEWKLKKGEFPSQEKLGMLKAAVNTLNVKMKEKKMAEVKEEIRPFANMFLEFLKEAEIELGKNTFKHEESKSIIESAINGMTETVNDVFGDAL